MISTLDFQRCVGVMQADLTSAATDHISETYIVEIGHSGRNGVVLPRRMSLTATFSRIMFWTTMCLSCSGRLSVWPGRCRSCYCGGGRLIFRGEPRTRSSPRRGIFASMKVHEQRLFLKPNSRPFKACFAGGSTHDVYGLLSGVSAFFPSLGKTYLVWGEKLILPCSLGRDRRPVQWVRKPWGNEISLFDRHLPLDLKVLLWTESHLPPPKRLPPSRWLMEALING